MQNFQKYLDAFINWLKKGYNANILAVVIAVVLLFIPFKHSGIFLLVSFIIIVISIINVKMKYDANAANNEVKTLRCPKCGSTDINIQVFQENTSSHTTTKTRTVYKEKGHGCLYWLLGGWFIDSLSWIFFTIPRLIMALCKKNKVVSRGTSVSNTKNRYGYKRVCVCQHCGHEWHN